MKHRIRMVEWFHANGLISSRYGAMLVRCAMRHSQPCGCQLLHAMGVPEEYVALAAPARVGQIAPETGVRTAGSAK